MAHKNRFQLILFDIDGTLLWPRSVGRDATRAAMLEVFGTFGQLDTHNFGGKTDWLTLVEVLGDSGYTEDDIGQIMPTYEKVVARHMTRMIDHYLVEACPGALDLIHQLRKAKTPALGIVTGNVSTTAPIKLRAAGFNPSWFPIGAFGSESVSRNQLPFLALERAVRYSGHQIRPDEVAVIGDTPADIACAQALGACAIAVTTGFSTPEALAAAQPDYLLDDLTRLIPLLGDK